LFDPGPGRLVEDLEQGPGVLAGLQSRPTQRRHARDGLRSGHDVQESAGDAEADPLGLGDGGELLLLVAGDLHGSLQAPTKGSILGLPVGELSPEVVDPSFGRCAVDRIDDLLGLAVERLSGLLTVLGHPGDVAVLAAEDGEGAGDALRDRGHGDSLRGGRSRVTPTIAHTSTRIVHQLPQAGGRFEIVPNQLAATFRQPFDLIADASKVLKRETAAGVDTEGRRLVMGG
jgi:hypothetical protein